MGFFVDCAQRLEHAMIDSGSDQSYNPGVSDYVREMITLLQGVERRRDGDTRHRDTPRHFHYFKPIPGNEGFEECVDDEREFHTAHGCRMIRRAGEHISGERVKGEPDGVYRNCPWCNTKIDPPQVIRERNLQEETT